MNCSDVDMIGDVNRTRSCGEPMTAQEGVGVVMAVYLGIVMVLGLVFNLAVCLIFYRKPHLISVSNMFVLNLTAAELCLATLVAPVALVSAARGSWQGGALWCRASGFLFSATVVALQYSLVAIAIDRNYAIANSLRYPDVFTPRLSYCLIAVSWLLASAIAMPPVLGWGSYSYQPAQFLCNGHWGTDSLTYGVFFLLMAFALPLSIQGYCYICILKAAMSHTKRSNVIYPAAGCSVTVDVATASSQQGSPDDDVTQGPRRRHGDCKAIRTLLLIAGAYFLCWSLFFTSLIVGVASRQQLPPPAQTAEVALVFLTCLANPLVYAVMNRAVRQEMQKLFKLCSKGVRRDLQAHTSADYVSATFTSTFTSVRTGGVWATPMSRARPGSKQLPASVANARGPGMMAIQEVSELDEAPRGSDCQGGGNRDRARKCCRYSTATVTSGIVHVHHVTSEGNPANRLTVPGQRSRDLSRESSCHFLELPEPGSWQWGGAGEAEEPELRSADLQRGDSCAPSDLPSTLTSENFKRSRILQRSQTEGALSCEPEVLLCHPHHGHQRGQLTSCPRCSHTHVRKGQSHDTAPILELPERAGEKLSVTSRPGHVTGSRCERCGCDTRDIAVRPNDLRGQDCIDNVNDSHEHVTSLAPGGSAKSCDRCKTSTRDLETRDKVQQSITPTKTAETEITSTTVPLNTKDLDSTLGAGDPCVKATASCKESARQPSKKTAESVVRSVFCPSCLQRQRTRSPQQQPSPGGHAKEEQVHGASQSTGPRPGLPTQVHVHDVSDSLLSLDDRLSPAVQQDQQEGGPQSHQPGSDNPGASPDERHWMRRKLLASASMNNLLSRSSSCAGFASPERRQSTVTSVSGGKTDLLTAHTEAGNQQHSPTLKCCSDQAYIVTSVSTMTSYGQSHVTSCAPNARSCTVTNFVLSPRNLGTACVAELPAVETAQLKGGNSSSIISPESSELSRSSRRFHPVQLRRSVSVAVGLPNSRGMVSLVQQQRASSSPRKEDAGTGHLSSDNCRGESARQGENPQLPSRQNSSVAFNLGSISNSKVKVRARLVRSKTETRTDVSSCTSQ